MKATYHHGDLKRALLDAALSLVLDRGVDAIRLREVARMAGVSPTATYRHFSDRAALVAAVAEEGFHKLVHMMREAQLPLTDPVARFQALGITYVVFASGHPAHFRVMFGAQPKSAHPALKAAEEEAFALCVSAIRECQSAGRIRPGDAVSQALAAWSLVHGLAGLYLDGLVQWAGKGTLSADQLAQQIGEILFLGLMA